jgi:TetR/AcrR family transcriptional regulator
MDSLSPTRDTILDTAVDLFSRKGYESTGIQEITDKAGITKPTLYYYFGSKQGLLEALIAKYGGELVNRMGKAAEYRHDPVMNLRGILRETLAFARQYPAFYRLGLQLFSAAPETAGYAAGRGLRRELVSILERFFAIAAGDHGNMKNREYAYAETFFGLLETWTLLSLNGEILMDDQLLYRVIHQYMHGIFS